MAGVADTIDKHFPGKADLDLLRYSQGRLIGMRTNRYSWWTHWRELGDYFLPRRYRWLVTANQGSRGNPINQHIIDSTGVVAARNLASGIMSGKTNPAKPWFRLKIGRIDSTFTTPVSLWLAECERLMRLIFAESNFYNAMATFYYDLVIFGTAAMLIFEDFENVINCINPCLGEYYVDIDGSYRPVIFYREFTLTISAMVDEFGYEALSPSSRQLYDDPTGTNRTREIIIAHAIEPNNEPSRFGFPPKFTYREVYWEWGGTASPQGGGDTSQGFLRKKGYYERPSIIGRWDLSANDPYGRSVAMDALGDQKQLQLESRRKAQGIDKMVNPPLVADAQLKNQPASLLPGGITYVNGYTQSGKPGFSSVYDTKFPINEMMEDLNEVRERLKKTFYNDVIQTASQFETRSNVTAMEWDMRKAESMMMLGPVYERIDNEVLKPVIERVFAMAARAGIFPPAPQEIQGKPLNIEFVSTLLTAQNAAEAAGIERLFGVVGNLSGIDPAVVDNVDVDFGVDKYSSLMNNDPRIIRSPEQLALLRQRREQQQEQAQRAQQAEQLAKSAKVLSETDVGGGKNAIQAMQGVS